jgi:hypothetical protein
MLKLERQVKVEAREPTVTFLDTNTIRIAMEAGRIDPRRAEKVIEMYSSLALKLVREPASPPLHPRGAITMSSWSLMRSDIL